MTQDSNRDAYMPWGEPAASAPVTLWGRLVTIPALVGHIVVMLTAMSVLTALNLLLNPGTWWSLAILMLWLTIVIVHVLARFTLSFLLDEGDQGRASPPRVDVEPHGPAMPGPGVPNGRRAARKEREDVPISWELKSDEAASSAWPRTEASSPTTRESETASSNGSSERVPWRAATDIAWLRRNRASGGTASDSNEEAPS
ncbi:MAG TPA: 2TM domain-containing protein [Thermomicrobiales bacterium]|nr:2TM domain-containing protein [Thermomicrobiales bacterium]